MTTRILRDRGVAEVSGRLVAAHATRPSATGGELAVSLANAAAGADERVDGGAAASLIDVVTLHNLSAHLANAAGRDEVRADAHHAVHGVDVAVDGGALTTNLAPEATDVLQTRRGIEHAAQQSSSPSRH